MAEPTTGYDLTQQHPLGWCIPDPLPNDGEYYQPFTIEHWVYLDSLPDNAGFITSITPGSSWNSGPLNLYFRTSSGGGYAFNGDGDSIRTGTPPIGKWFHLAWVFTGAECVVIEDGVEVGRDWLSIRVGRGFLHAHYNYPPRTINGRVARLRFWDRVLTLAEVVVAKDAAYKDSEPGLIVQYEFDDPEAVMAKPDRVYQYALLLNNDPTNADDLVASRMSYIYLPMKSVSRGFSKVSGIVRIDDTPAQRTVCAFGYDPTNHYINGEIEDLSRSLGHATSDQGTGEYTIDLIDGYSKPVFVVAFDDYGVDFTPDLSVAVGDRVHPTTPNSHVWECVGAGTLPSEEPTWMVNTETAQMYGTALMITRPFYRPMVHGPVLPELEDINRNDLLAALDTTSTLDSGVYTPETWSILDDDVQDGQAVYYDFYASQTAVDDATQAINDAMSGLVALWPTVIGEAFGGGFYAGDIIVGLQRYKLIVADIEADVYGLPWMNPRGGWTQAVSNTDGLSNTLSMAGDERFEAGNHCLDYRGGGFDDWYMPARSELQAIYENLGHDKTPPAGFENGGTQAFDSSSYYWSSTQYSSMSAHLRRLDTDYTRTYNREGTNRRVRPVRRLEFNP